MLLAPGVFQSVPFTVPAKLIIGQGGSDRVDTFYVALLLMGWLVDHIGRGADVMIQYIILLVGEVGVVFHRLCQFIPCVLIPYRFDKIRFDSVLLLIAAI